MGVFYPLLEGVGDIVGIVMNCIVAAVCWSAFSKHRRKSYALVGVSAMLGVFTGFVSRLLLPRIADQGSYAFVWTGTTVLYIVDMALYGAGVCLLVKELTNRDSSRS